MAAASSWAMVKRGVAVPKPRMLALKSGLRGQNKLLIHDPGHAACQPRQPGGSKHGQSASPRRSQNPGQAMAPALPPQYLGGVQVTPALAELRRCGELLQTRICQWSNQQCRTQCPGDPLARKRLDVT